VVYFYHFHFWVPNMTLFTQMLTLFFQHPRDPRDVFFMFFPEVPDGEGHDWWMIGSYTLPNRTRRGRMMTWV
jgi:hypothetical protein